MVSVIIPTFNRAHLISETLDSFVNQSNFDWEAIVVDDGSADDTEKVVTSYQNPKIRYYKRSEEHKKGPSGCRNFGLEKARGEFILFFDDDDIAHPDLLHVCLQQFEEKKIDFCRYLRTVFYGKFKLNFERGFQFDSFAMGSGNLDEVLTNKLPLNTCAVIWKRSILKEERFNEDLFYSDEWEFFERILSQDGINGVSLNKVLLFARKHEKSSTYRFLNSHPKFVSSTRTAINLVIEDLYQKNKLSSDLQTFFVRQSLLLQDKAILNKVLYKSGATNFTRLKYKIGYELYPVLKYYFRIKNKFSN